MDKLVQYIEGRIKRYGHVKSQQCVSSNYYTFGNTIIRVSDHLKYSYDNAKKFDYSFVIQPDNLYIMTESPKNSQMCRMYPKIMTLDKVKKFIKRLHDYSMELEDMLTTYIPDGWNRGDGNISNGLEWDKFKSDYIDILESDEQKLRILNTIEHIYSGNVSKGNYKRKLPKISEWFTRLSIVQLETLMKRLNINIEL